MRGILSAFTIKLIIGTTCWAQDVSDQLDISLPPSILDLSDQFPDIEGVENGSLTDPVMARALRASLTEDWESALTYAETAAAAGSNEGAVLAGHILLHGLSQRGKDDEAAIQWLRRAGERGDIDALIILSRLATVQQGGLTSFQAFDFLSQAVKSGDSRAAHEMGLYLIDYGDPGAASKAIDWLRIAAEAGYILSYTDYAYALGDWVHGPKDLTTARAWYELAGDNGNAYGALMAGAMHLAGEGDEANPKTGISWIKHAAELGHPAGMAEYALLLFQGATGLEPNPFSAVNWARKGAGLGDPNAQFLYAYALATGDGTGIDIEQAYFWVLRAGRDVKDSLSEDPDRLRLQATLEQSLSQDQIMSLKLEALNTGPF